jgi:glycosyltransferase involved in cell wall biosynthesis
VSDPKVSFIIATLNEAARLPRVLRSIRAQSYPSTLVEIVVVDGCSEDGTAQYAASEGCVVVNNPLRRGEPGLLLGYAAATGDIYVIMAADNVLHSPEYIRNIIQPFSNPAVTAALPRVVSTKEDSLTTRYINDFTDPFNHFLYGDAATPWTFGRVYRRKWETPVSVVYDFPMNAPPLVAVAQGTALRANFPRRAGSEEDDMLPIVDILRERGDIAYVSSATIEHHTVAGLGHFLRKFGPRIAKRLQDRNQPVWARSMSTTRVRRIRAFAWPFYAVSVVGPAAAAVYGAIRDRRSIWLFHPIISFALGAEFWRRVVAHAWSLIVLRRSAR